MAIEHIGIKDASDAEKDVAVDVVGTDNYQVIKIGLGADGAFDNLLDSGPQAGSSSLPVALSSEDNAVLDDIAASVGAFADSTDIAADIASALLIGVTAGSGSMPVALSNEDNAVLDTIATVVGANGGVPVIQTDLRGCLVSIEGTDSLQVRNIDQAGTYSDVTTYPLGTLIQGSDGTYRRNLTADAAGHLQVDVLTVPTVTVNSHAITNAGTFAVQVDGSALTSLQLIDDMVAADASAYGKGVLIQGDDGTDRRAVLVGTDGHLQVDVLSSPAVRALTNTDVVTAELSSTDNAVLDTIYTAVNTVAGAVSAAHMQVDVLTVPSHAVTNVGTFAVQATLAAETTKVLGTVNIASSQTIGLAAGTLGIGKLTANSGVDIGDVDILSIAAGDNNIGNVDIVTMPGTGVEDAAETAGGTLVMMGSVRRDTAAASAGTSGDNATINTDATGKLWTTGTYLEDVAEADGMQLSMAGAVRRDAPASSSGTSGDNSTINVDATGKLWVSGTYAEDAAHSSGDYGSVMLAMRDDTLTPTSGTEHDYEVLHTNNNGALFVETVPGTMWSAFHDVAGGVHTDIELQAAPGSGSLYITDIVITNDATLATTVKFEEDTGSAKTQKLPVMYIPASGGITIHYKTPIKLTATKNLGFTTTGTANTSIQANGYTAA
jgi:hypothetical protein